MMISKDHLYCMEIEMMFVHRIISSKDDLTSGSVEQLSVDSTHACISKRVLWKKAPVKGCYCGAVKMPCCNQDLS